MSARGRVSPAHLSHIPGLGLALFPPAQGEVLVVDSGRAHREDPALSQARGVLGLPWHHISDASVLPVSTPCS